MFRRLLQLPEACRRSFNGSSLQGILHGAAPCPVPVKQAMIEWWGPVIYEYYGATEGGLTAVDSEKWLARPGTVGTALPAWDVFAVGADGERLGPDEIGQIYFALNLGGPTFQYWKDEEKTAKAHLRPGVFTLGDIGRVDADGFVFLTDRASDMIISGGVNIYPAEVEAVLVAHPAVSDAAVFGIPNDDWGEEVKAAVELRAGASATADELIAFCREQLAHYKCPRSVDFEDELPRHTTGKLYKRLLRDRYWAGTGRLV
jgi:long-chain acyl-CoA synthetase